MTDKEQIKRAMHEVLNEWALGLGVDVTTTQAKLDLQADFRHLRRWRNLVENGGLKAAGVFITVALTGMLTALWLGLQTLLGRTS